ncbi:MAG: LuxR family transcriptional regulator [Bacteroidota bacterium]
MIKRYYSYLLFFHLSYYKEFKKFPTTFNSNLKNIVWLGILFITLLSCQQQENISDKNIPTLDYRSLKSQKNINIDSLYQVIDLRKDDTVKVNDLITIFRLSIRNRPIRNDILEEALHISKKINYETGTANCFNRIGVNARYNHEYLKSVKYHKEAISHYKSSWDIESRIKNLNSLGVSYRRLNMEEEAIKYYLEALKLSKKIDFTKSIAIALNGMGNAYITLHKYDDAIEYFNLALNMEKLSNSERGMGYDYSNLGEAYMYKKQYDTAFYYHNKSLEIANKLNNKNDKAIIYSSIGLMFQDKGELSKALDYYIRSIPILTKNNNKRLLGFTLINTGIVYKQLHNFEKAEEYIKSGLKISNEIASKENIVLAYKALSDLFEQKNDFKKAFNEYKLMTVYSDSMFNLQSDNNIAAMRIKYDSEGKDAKIMHLNLETKVQEGKILNQFLAIGFLVILGVFFIFYNRLRLKNKDLEIEDMRNNIEEYLGQISKLEDEDCRKSKAEISKKIENYGLSSREAEVLNYISQGMKNIEIADSMFVSLSTVKTHTKNIFDKLDVRNRIEAARKAQGL